MPPTPRKSAGPKKAAQAAGEALTNPFSSISDEPGFDPDKEPGFDLPETPPYRPSPLKNKLVQLYAGIGLGLSAFDPYCGSQIIANAEATGTAMDKLARENASVKRVLERLVATSVVLEVVSAHVPIMMAVAMHHGPDGLKNQLNGMAGRMNEAQNAA